MGDFTGFSFGDWNSTDPTTGITKILRVSGGDRYQEQLHPEIKDKTAEVPGRDGSYYFGSDYGPKTIDIEIAFDSLTELQLRELRRVFGTKEIKELIFKEQPYKKYMAKIGSPIELSYVCFDEPKKTIGAARDGVRVVDRTTSTEEIDGEEVTIITRTREQVTPYVYDYTQTQRIYKGEGKISFICYFPFAKSVYKVLPAGEEGSDWAISSGILTAAEYENGNIDNCEDGVINLYNPGDMATGFCFYLPQAVATTATTLNYKPNGSTITASLVINPITLKTINNTTDIGVLIDTTNQIIAGVSQYNSGTATLSDNIYNEYIQSGYFFQIEPGYRGDGAQLEVVGGASGRYIFYDYLYF